MSSNLVSIAGWYFLPNLVTGYVQTALYSIFIRAGEPKPTPGTPRFVRDRRKIQILVIVAYLLYTVYEADYQLLREGDLYSVLGVPYDVSEKGLQSRFRRLTVLHHPDKAVGASKTAIEANYLNMKLARDTLVDPARRFAYDRLGPEVLTWQNSKTHLDFIFHGATNIATFYFASAGVLILLAFLGYLKAAILWRLLFMAALCVFELHTLTRTHFPGLLIKVVNPIVQRTHLHPTYLPFQFIVLLRKLTLTIFIALSQLGPLLKDPITQAHDQQDANNAISTQTLDRFDMLTRATNAELSRLVNMELMPFTSDRAAYCELRSSLQEWLVQNTIRNDPEVKAAVSGVLDRRRVEDSPEGLRTG